MSFKKSRRWELKRTAALLLVFFFAAITVIGSSVAPVMAATIADGGVVSSGPDKPFNTFSPENQILVLSALGAIDNNSDSCSFSNGMYQDAANKDNWLSGKTRFGHNIEPDDGVLSCTNEQKWFTNLLNISGFSGNHLTLLDKLIDSKGTANLAYTFKPDAKAILKKEIEANIYGGAVLPKAPSYLVYSVLLANFTAPKACEAKPVDTNLSPDAAAKLRQGSDVVTLSILDQASNSVVTRDYAYPKTKENTFISVGFVADTDNGSRKCSNIASQLKDPKYATALANYFKANPESLAASDAAAGDVAVSDINLNCGSKLSVIVNPLNWVICPIIEGMATLAKAVDNGINRELRLNTEQTSDPSSGSVFSPEYKKAWEVVRNYALAFILIALLITVISQALGFEFLDAYTVKKILPRMLIATVAMALSWYLMIFLVELINTLGDSIRGIIYKPFSKLLAGDGGITLGGGGLAVSGLIGAGALASLGIIGLLSFVATAALAILVAFAVLVLRKIVIIILIILAPIAIICYVLPNTQKIYKIWWESFSKALLMFPIIVGFIAVGRVVAATASAAGGALNSFVAFIAYFAPYFLIPLTFKFAGGVLGNLGGFVNNKGRGGFDRLSKFRAGQMQKVGGRKMETIGRRSLQKRSDVVANLQGKSSMDGVGFVRKRAYRTLAGAVGGYNVEAAASAKRAGVGKEINDQIATGNDSQIRGLMVDKKTSAKRVNPDSGRVQYKSLGGGWVDEADVDAGQKRWGNDTFAQQAALSYEMRKATKDEDIENVRTNYATVAKSLGMSDNQAGGMWMGAAFENQNQHLQFKSTDWKTGKLDHKKFASEAYERKGSYQLSQMSAPTISALRESYDNGDEETKKQVQAVTETFMARGGGGPIAGMQGETPIQSTQQTGGAGQMGGVQTSVQGAAHVAEQVRALAEHVGVYQQLPNSVNSPPPFPPIPPQK